MFQLKLKEVDSGDDYGVRGLSYHLLSCKTKNQIYFHVLVFILKPTKENNWTKVTFPEGLDALHEYKYQNELCLVLHNEEEEGIGWMNLVAEMWLGGGGRGEFGSDIPL